jgi:hypothetical protein
LFDWLIVSYPLPDGYLAKNNEFQTKGLECFQNHYEITADGYLTRGGATVDFSGPIDFYDFDDAKVWHEYHAVFFRGWIRSLKVVTGAGRNSE